MTDVHPGRLDAARLSGPDVASLRLPAPGPLAPRGAPRGRLDAARLSGRDVASLRLTALGLETERDVRGVRSVNTTRAYRSDLDHFSLWCQRFSLDAMP